MSQPRYQIFVSSTFKDLKDEREAILNAILKLNQFPAGMELFPATNDTAWKHIEKIIKDSDYYVLVIGGKYGSMDETGISYTEKEYDFAVSQNIPILAFIRSDEENIPAGKIELDFDVREKLSRFKQKVGNEHHLNYWKSVEELKANVITSLSQSIVMYPQTGWVKAGDIDKNELLERYAQLQKRYDDLRLENNQLKDSAILFDTEKFAQGNDTLTIKFELLENQCAIDLNYNEIFFGIGEKLFAPCEINDVRKSLREIIFDNYQNSQEYLDLLETKKPNGNKYQLMSNIKMSEQSLMEISSQA